MSHTWAELKALPDKTLIEEYDSLAEHAVEGTNQFLAELRHRDLSRQSDTMLKYTQQVKHMTIVITIATIINVIILFIGLMG
jgi:hypothetical protein